MISPPAKIEMSRLVTLGGVVYNKDRQGDVTPCRPVGSEPLEAVQMPDSNRIVRTYSCRIYPTAKQEMRLFDYLDIGRQTFNHCLAMRRTAWQTSRRNISRYDQCKMLTAWRAEDADYRAIPLAIQRDALRRIELAFQRFFKTKQGYPRFKSRDRYTSFAIQSPGLILHSSRLFVSRIGLIKHGRMRPFDGTIKQLRIGYRAGRWSANIVAEIEAPAAPTRTIQNAIGIDVGLTEFATTSAGNTYGNPRFYRKDERKLVLASRVLSRRAKGGRNRLKAKRRLSRAHERIRNLRHNFTHQLSRQLINKCDVIAVENLNVAGMARSKFAKSILDAGWGQFKSQLRYKAESAGALLVEVDPKNTSQICSGCGAMVRKELSERTHDCGKCGLKIGRDVNAARNILVRGLKQLGLVEPEATPVEMPIGVSPKQEGRTWPLPQD